MNVKADDVIIGSAVAADAAAIGALLREADLPDGDFAAHLAHFLVARHAGTVMGAVGFEQHGRAALLRSLVVAPAGRGRGLGDRLVRQLAEAAATAGVDRFYLLTTTAENFFRRHGFAVIPRDQVPAAIAATEEFRSLCPASAVCLMRSANPATNGQQP